MLERNRDAILARRRAAGVRSVGDGASRSYVFRTRSEALISLITIGLRYGVMNLSVVRELIVDLGM